MTDNNWPDASKPGYPLNPERDGWHWVVAADPGVSTESAPWWWCADKQHWLPPVAVSGALPLSPSRVQWRYLGPCLTPAEVAARERAAAVAMREAAQNAAYLAAYEGKSPLVIAQTIADLRLTTDALTAMLAAARREGMEEAAKWHGEQAADHRKCADRWAQGSIERDWHNDIARQHDGYAAAIRAAAKEPGA